MSTPRDRDSFDDRPDDARGWQEPAHLGGEPAGTGGDDAYGGPPADPRAADYPPPSPPAPMQPSQPSSRRGSLGTGGLFRSRGDAAKVFAYQGDLVGAQGWALAHGWTITDGSGPEDAGLRDLVASAPVRPTKEHRPAGVLRGRAGSLELVAFDVVYPLRNSWVPEYAITAAPLLAPVPGFRLSPARFWRHRTAGLIPVTSGTEAFDARWLLLVTEDTPQLRGLIQDPVVQGLLLGSDDGDEFWAAAGHVAAIRPDGHRPELIEHHSRLLAAVVRALTPDLPDS
jgi:hypothetical protein